MATAYTEFTCLGQDLLANLQTAILASSDWTRPNPATLPNLYKGVTTRGAQMCVDLNDAAITTSLLTLGVYRTHDGTTGVDKITRYIPTKRTTTGSLAQNYYRGVVSVGKEHLFISLEGPRPGEVNTDSTSYGSIRSYFFMNDIIPYHPSSIDTVPAVAVGGWLVNSTTSAFSNQNHNTVSSRNPANTGSWSPGKLTSLTFPLSNWSDSIGVNWTGPDGDLYLGPYVLFDDYSGIRGRLASFFYAGFNTVSTYETAPNAGNQLITYQGKQYKLLNVTKSDGNAQMWGQFGANPTNSGADSSRSVIVAVPVT